MQYEESETSSTEYHYHSLEEPYESFISYLPAFTTNKTPLIIPNYYGQIDLPFLYNYFNVWNKIR